MTKSRLSKAKRVIKKKPLLRFLALAAGDGDGDGVVNAQDANWANLRVWQDLNQNAITDAGELKALAELGIVGINVTKTENSQILPNGNEIADLGTYTRTDGSEGTIAALQVLYVDDPDNSILDNIGNNVLSGLSGSDTIAGSAGNALGCVRVRKAWRRMNLREKMILGPRGIYARSYRKYSEWMNASWVVLDVHLGASS